MKCNANNKKKELTFEFRIGDNESGKVCVLHLPMRFRKCFEDLKISDKPKYSKEFDLSKPIRTNNASALQKFSEVVLDMTPKQMTAFSKMAAKGYPTTISDLLAIALEAGEYKCLYADNYYSLARGFVNYMQMADPAADVCKTEEEDFEEFGRYIVNKTGGFFFKNYFYYN